MNSFYLSRNSEGAMRNDYGLFLVLQDSWCFGLLVLETKWFSGMLRWQRVVGRVRDVFKVTV